MATIVEHSATRCPSQEELLAFSSGKLPQPQIESFGRHLSSCETCLAFLDSQTDPEFGRSVLNLPVTSAAEVESDQSAWWDTAFERRRKDSEFQRMKAKAKRIDIRVGGETAIWNPPKDSSWKSADEILPEKIGRYFVLRKLGRGGFANVYLARDPELNRLAAIKVPRTDKLKSPTQIEEFLAEARTAATLDHPHIVPVFDFDRLPDGGCFVVMKYIEGRSLQAAMESERFSFARSAELSSQIADALEYAHQKGFVHRDIKPANILLGKDDHPYVADFGLAIHEETQQQNKGQRAGTWPYMSPEQVRGESDSLDGRSDIWSLGVILYELLTRNKPFHSQNRFVLEKEIQDREPKPPRSYDPRIPARLEQICLSSLAKKVAARTPSAAQFAVELRQWLRSKKRIVFAAAGVLGILACLVLAGLGVAQWGIPFTGTGDTGTPATPAATTTAQRDEWKSLFESKGPYMFFGPPGPDHVPQFDFGKKSYSVRSSSGRWIATAQRIKAQPIQLRTAVSLHNWLGTGGIVWGFKDEDQQPPNQVRWRCVEFVRFSPADRPQLMVRDLTLSGGSTILNNRVLQVTPINVPDQAEAVLEIDIEPKLLRIKFDDNPAWTLTAPNQDIIVWFPATEFDLGISGDSSHTIFRDLSMRYLFDKE